MTTGIKAALEARQNKSLDIKVRYSEGIMTRREWLRLQMIRGATVNEGTKNRIQYNRTKFNRMWSNQDQDEYMKKCNEKVRCYELHLPNESAFWEITKAEYEYFNNMQLSQDKVTEQMELTYKIETGIATEDEVKEDEVRDLEFFKKYS
jgi:hypothetical protein